jgi:hypothetical protein
LGAAFHLNTSPTSTSSHRQWTVAPGRMEHGPANQPPAKQLSPQRVHASHLCLVKSFSGEQLMS